MKVFRESVFHHRVFCDKLEGGYSQFVSLNHRDKVTKVELFNPSGDKFALLIFIDGIPHYYRFVKKDDGDWVWDMCTKKFFSWEELGMLNIPFFEYRIKI